MEKQKITFMQRNAVTIKMVVVATIVLLLLIPKSMISSLIWERQRRQQDVFNEISDKWSADQKIIGPILGIPMTVSLKDEKGKPYSTTRWYYAVPEELEIDNKMSPEERHIGIYDFLVYHSTNKLDGSFAIPNIQLEEEATLEKIHWNEATISFELSDIRGIENQVVLSSGDQSFQMKPQAHNLFGMNTIAAQPFLNGFPDKGTIPFHIDLNVKGSLSLQFSPIAKSTQLRSYGAWNAPKFTGSFPPNTPEITTNGYVANWNVLEYNRNIPSSWISKPQYVNPYYFGVELVQVNDHYQKSERSSKYAILIIALTFLAFFLAEVLMKLHVHPIQYVLIGLALCIFYVLLLSLAEHLGFNYAYLMAATATVTLITSYASAIFRKFIPALTTGVALSLFYAFIFVIIQLEDFALLAGSIGLFIILATTMFLTRNIKWNQLGRASETD